MNRAQVDHLVVVAASLAQGVAWCEDTLGITPGPGGEHPLMGTHNRLFSVAGPAFPRAYVEIIAIQPGVTPRRAAGTQRWFDMDDRELQARVASEGPQLVHFVASVPGVVSAVKALAALGLDRGSVVEVSRQTATALLQWRITVRDDGQRLFYGTLPTLIQWGEAGEDPARAAHPLDAMPASGVTLQALQVSHPRPEKLEAAYAAIGLAGVTVTLGAPNLLATLQTPRGFVTLESKGV
ncbi:MAG: VOC family protein [Polaromonas sp.]|uniref:VOC family protein n=1 Tax=Polaromonas sp. TaxID=1869339 RepID=UPI00273003E9|nr:VOC family protein [Polaromonas sp.]MDP2449453.1 VOC family protein [Polaromonas sp.]MDP3247934.1 VOC family protein [Polaromonas sp.]MDP3754407.1 VOC family protein [Polaromonas sp.]MDP3827796.1 VOC family protein [Polaromonas sp.]